MAVSYIKVNTQILNKDINEMREQVEQVREQMKAMTEEMSELAAMWDGPAHDALQNQFLTDCDRLQEILQEMQTFFQSLERAKTTYDKCEIQVEDIVNAINL